MNARKLDDHIQKCAGLLNELNNNDNRTHLTVDDINDLKANNKRFLQLSKLSPEEKANLNTFEETLFREREILPAVSRPAYR